MSKFHMPSDVRAKHVAHEIRDALAGHGIPIKLSAAYEATAHAYGFGTWNSLRSSIGSAEPTPDDGLVDAETARRRRDQHIRAVMAAGAPQSIAEAVIDTVRPTARGVAKSSKLSSPDITRAPHGPATLIRARGIPHSVENARTDDGRSTVEFARIDGKATWRRRDKTFTNRWITGSIQLRSDDIVFFDHPGQDDRSEPDLARDLAGDDAFLARLQDDAFACAFYDHMEHARYRFGSHLFRWIPSWKDRAYLVCELRGLCEDSVMFDQYLLAPDTSDADKQALDLEIDAHLARIGWFRLTAAEIQNDRRKALDDLSAFEARPPGERPYWADDWTPSVPRNNQERLQIAAVSGRITRAEYVQVSRGLGWQA